MNPANRPQRPALVTLLALLLLLLAALALFTAYRYGGKLYGVDELEAGLRYRITRAFWMNLGLAPVFLALSGGLFWLKDWARKGTVAVCVLIFAWIVGFNVHMLATTDAGAVELAGAGIGIFLALVFLGAPVALLLWPGTRALFQGRLDELQQADEDEL